VSDPIKPSRLLLRLESEAANAKTTLEADCKRAEIAIYWARQGRLDDATREVEEVRARYSKNSAVEISIRANLAEALIEYFGNFGTPTIDGVQRAYALSVAAGHNSMRAVCAAWLAQLAYFKLDMRELARFAREALKYSTPSNYMARSRSSLVIAQALHLAGRPDLAKLWYSRSRLSATEDGDDATISALMHNMAWLRMLGLRQAVLSGVGNSQLGKQALLSAESTVNLSELTGDSSWYELAPILRAQILSLQDEAIEALGLYDKYLTEVNPPSRLQANLFADKAWCHLRAGDGREAASNARQALDSLTEQTQLDDRAATHSRLSQVFAGLGNVAQQERHAGLARVAWSDLRSVQSLAIELLSSLDAEELW